MVARGIVGLVAGVAVTALVTITANFLPSVDDFYGAPIPVGRSCFDILFMRCQATFSWLVFIVDCVLNSLLWLAITRVTGILGMLAAVVGAFLSVVLITAMLSYQLPIAGFPIPLGWRTVLPNALAIWLNALAWAAGFAALVRFVRGRRRPRPAKP